MDYLNYKKLLRDAKNSDLKVTLKKTDEKGVGLFCSGNKPIKKGEIIAFYKVKIFKEKDYESPTNFVYSFQVYRKNGQEYKRLIADVNEECFPPPEEDNISYWAPFANEPSQNQRINAEIDIDVSGNYANKTFSQVGEFAIYKLVANHMIRPGEEILWFYGDNYDRNYKVGKT